MELTFDPEPVPLALVPDGVVRVGKTRVTLDTVVGTFNEGATPEEIVIQYDTLRLADVYVVIGYYLRHRGEVEAYLEEREREAEEVRRTVEARSSIPDIRERLLARRAQSATPKE